MELYKQRDILIKSPHSYKSAADYLVTEYPVTIFINDHEFVTLVCTPDSLQELAAGFLQSEGLIATFADIQELTVLDGGFVKIKLEALPQAAGSFLKRNLSSCCGRGRSALYFINDARQVRAVPSAHLFNADNLVDLIARLEDKAELFNLTGGAHFAALLDTDTLCFFEDIGRHNAVDKVVGWSVLNGIDNKDKILALSGRISSEIVIKAARGAIPVIISKAAPTDLAIELAGDLQITLIGFARNNKINVYSCPEKLSLD